MNKYVITVHNHKKYGKHFTLVSSSSVYRLFRVDQRVTEEAKIISLLIHMKGMFIIMNICFCFLFAYSF